MLLQAFAESIVVAKFMEGVVFVFETQET